MAKSAGTLFELVLPAAKRDSHYMGTFFALKSSLWAWTLFLGQVSVLVNQTKSWFPAVPWAIGQICCMLACAVLIGGDRLSAPNQSAWPAKQERRRGSQKTLGVGWNGSFEDQLF